MVLLNRSPLKMSILLEVLSESKFKSLWEKILNHRLIFFIPNKFDIFEKQKNDF